MNFVACHLPKSNLINPWNSAKEVLQWPESELCGRAEVQYEQSQAAPSL